MIKKIDHVAVAVNSIGDTVEILSRLLGSEPDYETIPTQAVNTAIFRVGSSNLELIEASAPDSTVARYLEKRGQSIHHLCLDVDDMESTIVDLKEKGFEFVDEIPRIGTEGKKIVFLHPKSTAGILIELNSDQ